MPKSQPQPAPVSATRRVSGGLSVGGDQVKLPAPPPPDPQAFPPITTQAANLFQSVVAFVGDGGGLVDDAEYGRRVEVCRGCNLLRGERCVACGCFVKLKARGRVFRCPIGRWQ